MDDKEFIQRLLNVIDDAYWRIEVGDRIGAIQALSMFAKPRKLDDSHWLSKNKKEDQQ